MNPMSAETVARFRAVVEHRLGLNFADDKRDFLADILYTQSIKNGEVPTTYLDRLELKPAADEWQALVQLLTVPETYFFRYFDQFRAFAEVALRERMQAQRHSGRLSILSAGCASGEEAYSLAMMMREVGIDAAWKVSIRAADINPAVIDRAKRARYSAWSLRETPAEVQRRWFRSQGRDYVLDDVIRDAVQFEQRNLSEDDAGFWREASYDIIFCRNMMMYFSARNARVLLERITRALVPGGYLFLGHAETLRGLPNDFHICNTHGTFYYQRRTAAESGPLLTVGNSHQQLLPFKPIAADKNDAWMSVIQRSAERVQALTRLSETASAPMAADKKIVWDLHAAHQLLRQERFAEALDVIRVLPAEAAHDAQVQLLKAVLCIHSGQRQEAEQVCQALLAIDELNSEAEYVLALCREDDGDNRAAINHDQTAIYLDANFAMPHLHLGLLARRAGDHLSARRELEQASILLQREDAARVLLFGGGFGRDALLALCRAELTACGGQP